MRIAARQVDAQLQTAVKLVHKLTAVAARRVVHGDGLQGFFAAQPGVADGALFGMHGLLHGRPEKLHIAAEVPGAAYAARNGTHVEMGQVGAGAGRRQRQKRKGQRVIIQIGGTFQCGDLLSRQQGGEVCIRQNRGQG
ncbi:hypothetical protein D3C76_1376530 [compost metagenome]